jgi:hypothetical protein
LNRDVFEACIVAQRQPIVPSPLLMFTGFLIAVIFLVSGSIAFAYLKNG